MAKIRLADAQTKPSALFAAIVSTAALVASRSTSTLFTDAFQPTLRFMPSRAAALAGRQTRSSLPPFAPMQLQQSRKSDLESISTERSQEPSTINGSGDVFDAIDDPIFMDRLAKNANSILGSQKKVQEAIGNPGGMSRRVLFGSALIGTSAVMAQSDSFKVMAENAKSPLDALLKPDSDTNVLNSYPSKLSWEATPINKRTGVTIFDAERAGYNVRFVTYLARFLLVFDVDCQRWWYARAADIPRRASAEQVTAMRLSQFAAFSASVEVGLQEYRGSDGPARLLDALLKRYCPDIESVRAVRAKRGLPPLSPAAEDVERREIKEARRQIALLFGLMEINQPVDRITQLLAAIDNGTIESVEIRNPGSGYSPGYGPPLVEFPEPKAGPGFERATGRATLQPNGRILRLDITDRGSGYNPKSPPNVFVTPPGADRGVDIPQARAATAKASVFRSGPRKGQIQQIMLVEPGFGYLDKEEIRVVIDPPPESVQKGGVQAKAKPVLELQVASIQIVSGGNGYAVEKPIPVYVEPPPATARINLNDPVLVNSILYGTDKPTNDPNARKMAQALKDSNQVMEMLNKLTNNGGNGGGGGCVGRGCYDNEVVAVAAAKAETSSFSTFRNEGDALKPVKVEEALMRNPARRIVSGTSSGELPMNPFYTSGKITSSSAQLLTLLPAGLGLEYDTDLKRYALSAGNDFIDRNQETLRFSSNRPLDPEFGPRGRSPIERDIQLDLSSYLRFCLSGAICCSGVHLVLTPIDVVKTKVQTDPDKYPSGVTAFNKLVEESGLSGFFTGWAPTFVGFFLWGGFSYSFTELLRRYFNEAAGVNAASLEVPIILAASAIGSFFGVFILCPFEAVRIRSVAQPGYGSNIFAVTTRMVKEEGVGSLFNAIPPFLLKEVPFAMAKFTTFAVSTRLLYEAFPVTKEDIQLSLLVSVVGGVLGGLAAAVVSNPGDATISEMKKAKSDDDAFATAKSMVARGGISNLFRGLPLRLAFYPLVVSLQFLVYDAVRISLGIGSDDLKVYLDVLGGALRDGGSMVGPV